LQQLAIRFTKSVKWIMIICGAVFLIQQTSDKFMGGDILSWFALTPAQFVNNFYFWQIFTYMFLHGGVMHLFLNLLMLLFIGGDLEATWGTRKFLLFYMFCGVMAGVFYLMLQGLVSGGDGLFRPMVGASGAIYGLLIAYGLIFSDRTLLFLMLFPMKAKYFVWVLIGVEFFTTVYSDSGALSSLAHLGGMFAGIIYLWWWARIRMKSRQGGGGGSGRGKRRKKSKGKSNLKLVVDNEEDYGDGGDDEGPRFWN